MKVYRAAVVGLGRVGAQYPEDAFPRSHVSAYLKNPRFELVAVADPSVDARGTFMERWRIFHVKTYSSAKEMMRLEQPDVVTVCVPPRFQPEVVEELLGVGKPCALILEKPFAADAEGARRLASVLERHEVPACIHFNRSWDGPHERFAARVKDPVEGKVLGARVVYTRGMYNYAGHLVAFLIAHFGPVSVARGLRPGQTESADPNHSFCLDFEAGFSAHFLGVDVTVYDVLEMDVFTEAGVHSLEAGGCRRRLQRGKDGLFYPNYPQLERLPPPEPDTQLQSFEPLVCNAAAFLDGAEPFKCPWQVGMAVMEALEAVKRSLDGHGEAVAVSSLGRRTT